MLKKTQNDNIYEALFLSAIAENLKQVSYDHKGEIKRVYNFFTKNSGVVYSDFANQSEITLKMKKHQIATVMEQYLNNKFQNKFEDKSKETARNFAFSIVNSNNSMEDCWNNYNENIFPMLNEKTQEKQKQNFVKYINALQNSSNLNLDFKSALNGKSGLNEMKSEIKNKAFENISDLENEKVA